MKHFRTVRVLTAALLATWMMAGGMISQDGEGQDAAKKQRKVEQMLKQLENKMIEP